jgi:exodeoxyribonuclease VII large subunit
LQDAKGDATLMSNMQLFSVADVASYVKQLLDRDLVLRDLWVSGEVSNFTQSAAGHCYFTLKDAQAQMRCVLFKGQRGVEHLSNGAAVNAHGRVAFYETRGDLQLYVDMVQPSGMGVLAAELERLKVQLEEEGLFEPSRKRPLPEFPRRIGVVTSGTGAVLHDIQTVVGRRYPLAELIICPSAVQGDKATAEVVDAIQTLNASGNVDVIIVARGGGSLEELWAFNTEPVARAIYASQAPVVSAIGHETDFTIADLVADMRAPTPSAAAELVCPDGQALAMDVFMLAGQAHAIVSGTVREARQSVAMYSERMRGRAPDVGAWRQQVDDILNQGWQRLGTIVEQRREQTRSLEAQLTALSPRDVLRRGYATLRQRESGMPVTSASDARPGDVLRATVHDGEFDARVEDDAPDGES